jgi:hypothetical protein
MRMLSGAEGLLRSRFERRTRNATTEAWAMVNDSIAPNA